MQNILVTGANGYIGSHVIKQLVDMYGTDKIIAVDFNNNHIDNKIKFIKIDLLDNASNPALYTMLGEPDAIIHLAWQDGFNHRADSHISSLPAHYAFLKNMVDNGVSSMTVMGTMHEVGYHQGEVNADTPCNPLAPYGIAKNALRQLMFTYCDDKPVSLKWLRAFYITGDDKANKSIFAKILQIADDGQKTFPFTTGENKYDFEDVNILAKQIAVASTQNEVSGIINCCSGIAVSLKNKVESFIKDHKLNIKPEYGAYPPRKYDSPAIFGNATLINTIMSKHYEK